MVTSYRLHSYARLLPSLLALLYLLLWSVGWSRASFHGKFCRWLGEGEAEEQEHSGMVSSLQVVDLARGR